MAARSIPVLSFDEKNLKAKIGVAGRKGAAIFVFLTAVFKEDLNKPQLETL